MKAVESIAVVPVPRRSAPVACVAMVAERAILTTWRNPPIVVTAMVQSVVFLLIFRFVFGGAIASGELPYVDFMVPGLLAAGVLFSVMRVASSVAEDRAAGVVDRFRSLPMPPSAVLIGRAVGDHVLTISTLAATSMVAFAVGFRVREGFWGIAAMLALCLLAAVAFTWVFIAAGLAVGSVQAAQGVGFLVLPVSFVSSAYVPVSTMPGWLQAFATHQPFTVLVEANRYLAQGEAGLVGATHSGGYYVVAAVAWCAGILVVAASAAFVLFRRR
ncbi:ABC transporter permease [Nocardia ninae]|uniref:Transport permease protein n=1 Tax=Nocardia ninae NBRC 108245 TaxID=1210091 RepID=A0A511M7T9_9NOCA|nr:ABC transporter permease [Nocardia ninae]GEM36257.1 transport permease protein [Nocardia ninae NBRC 108245]